MGTDLPTICLNPCKVNPWTWVLEGYHKLFNYGSDQDPFFRTSSYTVTSGGERKRMGGPQVPEPRLT